MKWLRAYPFETHTTAFIMMMAPPILIFLATNNKNYGLAGGLLGIMVLGNLLELAIG